MKADYTYVNERLARHYGIEGVYGNQFRRVAVQDDNRRGLLGQGSILMVTALANRTSPVQRGKWVLENLLAEPPPPPPPDIPPLITKSEGAKGTIRQQMEAHRNSPACIGCHSKMDPIGFALENFDPIGNYRTVYHKTMRWNKRAVKTHKSKGPKVDPTSTLPTGEKINNLKDLKKALYKRRSQFAIALTEKLMTFATGREMTFKEHAEIKRIASLKPAEEYGFKDLVREVVKSEVFIQR